MKSAGVYCSASLFCSFPGGAKAAENVEVDAFSEAPGAPVYSVLLARASVEAVFGAAGPHCPPRPGGQGLAGHVGRPGTANHGGRLNAALTWPPWPWELRN
jgi:hypothetical protein